MCGVGCGLSVTACLVIKNDYGISIMETSNKSRLLDIEACKGLAIFLVVLGHVGARSVPADAHLYEWLRGAIYLFHMPFFMFFSGFIFLLSFKPLLNIKDLLGFCKKKFWRLFPAYFLLALLVFFGKWGAQQFVHVDNPVGSLQDLVKIVLYPMQSVSAFVWYIYVLFLMMLLTGLLHGLLRIPLVVLLVLAALMLLLPKIPLLGMSQLTRLYFFFVFGCLAYCERERYWQLIGTYWRLALLLLVFLLICWTVLRQSWLWFPISLLSIPALHGWLRSGVTGFAFLVYLGTFSFVIYLFNTICIGVGKVLLLQWIPMQEYWYSAVYVPILTLAGIAIPLLLKRWIFPFFPWLNRITS